MAGQKLALTNDGYDLCRIRPRKLGNGNLDFMLDFLGKEVDIYTCPLFAKQSQYFGTMLSLAHITYHAGTETLSTKLQVSYGNNHKIMPLKNLIDPVPIPIFPIPLARIIFPNNHQCKQYKPATTKEPFDLQGCNEIELYLYKHDNSLVELEHSFKTMFYFFLAMSFDYFAKMDTLSIANAKVYNEMKINEDRIATFKGFMLNDVGVFCKAFHNTAINVVKPCIQFIDNAYFLHVWATTQLANSESENNGSYLRAPKRKDLAVEFASNELISLMYADICVMQDESMREEYKTILERLRKKLLVKFREADI